MHLHHIQFDQQDQEKKITATISLLDGSNETLSIHSSEELIETIRHKITDAFRDAQPYMKSFLESLKNTLRGNNYLSKPIRISELETAINATITVLGATHQDLEVVGIDGRTMALPKHISSPGK